VEGNRWQALQSHLKAARIALQDGDKIRALDEVNGALALDPAFTAALALRDRIIATESTGSSDAPAEAPPPMDPTAPPPIVSAEGYARFEERTRRRRIDKRADAAIAAIAGRRFAEAAAAIQEIRELNPEDDGLPALQALLERERFAGERRAPLPPRASSSRGPQFAAAAVFAAVMLAAPRLQPARLLASRPISVMASLAEDAQPAPMSSARVPEQPLAPTALPSTIDTTGTIATTGTAVSADALNALSSLPPPPYRETPTPSPSPATIVQPVTSAPPPEAPPKAPDREVPRPTEREVVRPVEPTPSPVLVASAPAVAPASAVSVVTDDALIRQALQRYRSAYERLDAQSALAVYPAVNERALARAFDDLESQHLTFDSCEVQVHGESAAAACRGTTRYVTKVGSRDPRTESRVWNFTLRKDGTGWKIDTARAER
jgi:hypothetical protein